MRRLDIGYELFVDLDEVLNDARNVRMGVIALGANDRDIIEIEDCDFAGFEKLFKSLEAEISKNWKQRRERTLIFFYYAGHGQT